MVQVQKVTEGQRQYVEQLNGAGMAVPASCDRLVFHEPWNSRAFGLAIALSQNEICSFEDFRENLIQTIGNWETKHGVSDPSWEYYEQWLAALEKLALDRGLVTSEELDSRTEEFRTRSRDEVI